jgi:hypothetical protein
MTPPELKSGHCTSGHCASRQLSLTWFLSLDGTVPLFRAARFGRAGAVPAGAVGRSCQMARSNQRIQLRFVVEAAGIASIFLSVTLVAYIVFFYW